MIIVEITLVDSDTFLYSYAMDKPSAKLKWLKENGYKAQLSTTRRVSNNKWVETWLFWDSVAALQFKLTWG